LLLHIGAHKTGTTLIQRALEERRDWLEGRGVSLVHNRHPIATEARLTQAARCFQAHGSAPGVRRRLRELVRKMERLPTDRVLLSSESLLGPPFPHSPSQDDQERPLYRHADEMLQAVATRIPAPRRVALYIRPQAGFLESFFAQSVGRLPGQTFEEWCSGISVDRLGWRPVVESAAAAFGGERIMVKTFAVDELGPSGHVAEFVREVLDLDGGDDWEIPFSNPTYSGLAVTILERVADLPMNEQEWRRLRVVLKKEFSVLQRRDRRAFLDEEARAAIDARYVDENRALIEEFGTDTERARLDG